MYRNRMTSFRVRSFGQPFAKEIAETPVPTGRQVVLEVSACGLCHTDLHLLDGYFDLGNGAKADVSGDVRPPRTLGHEIAGTVIAVGPDVTDAKIGDRRVMYPWLGCGKCDICLAGNEQICHQPAQIGIHQDGGFSTRVLCPDEKYLIDYGDLTEEQACTYACSGLTAYASMKKVQPLPRGGKWLLIGAGGVGLSGIRLASALGLPPPIVAEVDKARWDIIRGAGACDILDPTEKTAARKVREMTDGGVDAVIDFVGSGDSFEFGFKTLTKGGRLIVVGMFGGTAKVPPALLGLRAVSILGSHVGTLQDMKDVIQIARSGVLPALPVATRPLHEINEAASDLRSGKVRGRVVLLPPAGTAAE